MKDLLKIAMVFAVLLLLQRLQEHENDAQNHKDSSADLGDQGQLCFHTIGLVLAEESFGSAAYSAQAGLFAALQQNGNNHDQSGYDKQNANNHVH